jgi:hypothetical protein
MCSKEIKQKFVSTEAALGRAHDLSLSKDDPMIAKCIKIMERYIRGDETWTDYIEKHKDNGKGHLFCRPFMTAAQLNMFDPENPVITPLRDVVAETLATAFASGSFDENYWNQKVNEYHVPVIAHPCNMYGVMSMQNSACMDDTLQKRFLDYVWNGKGIYYASNIAPADKQVLEDKRFNQWFRTLELLSGYSLFPDFMKNDVLPHLLGEVDRLMNEDLVLTNHNCRYAENWRDKSKRKTDVILRITRVLAKC